MNQRLPGGPVRVQDIGLSEAEDPTILSWAAAEGRILPTHDREIMPGFAYERVRNGLAMPGIFLINDSMPAGQAIAELILAIQTLGLGLELLGYFSAASGSGGVARLVELDLSSVLTHHAVIRAKDLCPVKGTEVRTDRD